MTMLYKPIVDAVLKNGFPEAARSDAQQWVQARHAWLWDAEEWTFREGSGTVTFTAGSQVVSLGTITDFRAVVALYNAQGAPLRAYKDHREFFDAYNVNAGSGAGAPEAYTVFGGQLLVGPKGDGTTGLLLYEKNKPPLAGDNDPTGLPDGYDLSLVHGGKAEGFKLKTIPMWQSFDEDFTASVNAMRRNYLVAVREQGSQQFQPFRPGQQWR